MEKITVFDFGHIFPSPSVIFRCCASVAVTSCGINGPNNSVGRSVAQWSVPFRWISFFSVQTLLGSQVRGRDIRFFNLRFFHLVKPLVAVIGADLLGDAPALLPRYLVSHWPFRQRLVDACFRGVIQRLIGFEIFWGRGPTDMLGPGFGLRAIGNCQWRRVVFRW